jgi:hypothetical protein
MTSHAAVAGNRRSVVTESFGVKVGGFVGRSCVIVGSKVADSVVML